MYTKNSSIQFATRKDPKKADENLLANMDKKGLTPKDKSPYALQPLKTINK